jgi:hypothetical protein
MRSFRTARQATMAGMPKAKESIPVGAAEIGFD